MPIRENLGVPENIESSGSYREGDWELNDRKEYYELTKEEKSMLEDFEKSYSNYIESLQHRSGAGPRNKEAEEEERRQPVQSVIEKAFPKLEKIGLYIKAFPVFISSDPMRNLMEDFGIASDDIEDRNYKSITIELGDGERFLKYFDFLIENKLNKNQIESLMKVAQSFLDQINKFYLKPGIIPNSDRMIELMEHLGEILKNYKRIGINKDKNLHGGLPWLGPFRIIFSDLLDDLDDYKEASEKQYLKQCVLAKNNGIFRTSKPDIIMANRWHFRDYESLEEKLEGAMSIIKQLKEIPGAKKFRSEIIRNLIKTLMSAKDDLKKKPWLSKVDLYKKNNLIDKILNELEYTYY